MDRTRSARPRVPSGSAQHFVPRGLPVSVDAYTHWHAGAAEPGVSTTTRLDCVSAPNAPRHDGRRPDMRDQSCSRQVGCRGTWLAKRQVP